MKLKSIRVQNFRGFSDQEIELGNYTCFVGPNGGGKSTILSALNVFFCERMSSVTDVTKLEAEDFHHRKTDEPIRITVTFCDLGVVEAEELSAYVRNSELVVTAEAKFDPASGLAEVHHFGQRLVMREFAAYFEADKAKANANELRAVYSSLKAKYPELVAATTKAAMADSLQVYEVAHPGQCELLPSNDEFYGVNSTGKLAKFIQWVYVPAVKDAGDECQEGKNTALGRLLARAVESRTGFDAELKELQDRTKKEYGDLLTKHEGSLTAISGSLQKRLAVWSHPDVDLKMEWLSDAKKSVTVQAPVAGIKTGDGGFLGSLSRMGHGLQRSYLLALLQELAESGGGAAAPTLVLGCEEPELYQHPPQARHLAQVFQELSEGNNQILVTTHSPYFVSGEGFEDVRVVSKAGENTPAVVRSLSFEALCAKLRKVTGEQPKKRNEGMIAKLNQALQPGLAEMLFTRVVVLVEGLEDLSYIMTHLHLSGKWVEFRRLGCHIVPANGKDRLIQPLAILSSLCVPVFVVFDADGVPPPTKPDVRAYHERDNKALFALLGLDGVTPFPPDHLWGDNFTVWRRDLCEAVKGDYEPSAYTRTTETARQHYAHEGGLEKNDLFIAEWMTAAHDQGLKSQTLEKLCSSILKFAGESATVAAIEGAPSA